MINKYRKKFIFVTMISLFVVFGFMMTLINVINYIRTCKDSDLTIMSIIDNREPFNFNPGEMPPMDNPNAGPMDKEARFRTRFAIISFDESGNVTEASSDNISLSEEEVIEIAKTINSKNTSRGFYEQYRFNVIKDNNGKKIVILDCAKEKSSNRTFLLISLVISLSSYLVIFGVMVIVSKIVVRPFFENMEKQKRFITDASHELKTPLTIMNADLEVLEIENGTSEWSESIKAQIKRLTEMTHKLTLLSKMDEDNNNYTISDLDISNILKNVIEEYYPLSSVKEIKIDSSIEDDIHIKGNEELIIELFHILLENGYKYSLDDISVVLKKENKNVSLSFANKADVPDGALDYLFDRFYRLEESRNSKTGGNGIGLSIAKEIVEIHNGTIKAYGDNGIITFKINFKA